MIIRAALFISSLLQFVVSEQHANTAHVHKSKPLCFSRLHRRGSWKLNTIPVNVQPYLQKLCSCLTFLFLDLYPMPEWFSLRVLFVLSKEDRSIPLEKSEIDRREHCIAHQSKPDDSFQVFHNLTIWRRSHMVLFEAESEIFWPLSVTVIVKAVSQVANFYKAYQTNFSKA